MWSDHKRIEERSLALHREIASRLNNNPDLLAIAKGNLDRWIKKNAELSVLREWQEILKGPLSRLLDMLVSGDEKSRRLRQSSPFCGILTPQERWKIYESYTIRAYNQGSGKRG